MNQELRLALYSTLLRIIVLCILIFSVFTINSFIGKEWPSSLLITLGIFTILIVTLIPFLEHKLIYNKHKILTRK